MASTQVRISNSTYRVLQTLSGEGGESMQSIIDKAVEQYKRRRFLEGLNDDFVRLKQDPDAWQHELAERRVWDSTLSDDIEDE